MKIKTNQTNNSKEQVILNVLESMTRNHNLCCGYLGLPKNFFEESDTCCKTNERINNIMENYIVINGKKAELTDEQMKQLGINVAVKKETPFARHSSELYWFINTMNVVVGQQDCNDDFNNNMYDNVNYFNDYKFAEQVAFQQLLYRKLLKYAYENDDVNNWTELNSRKYFIIKSIKNNKFDVDWSLTVKNNCVVYFNSEEVAEQAIEDVVEPFMEEHPEFLW